MSSSSTTDVTTRPYQCSICNKTYNRSSHLRRHEVTHSEEKTSRCFFCNRHFAKVEVARRHSKRCAGKANAPPPPQAKRGRKARACDRCSNHKTSCDAQTPCSRCRAQGKLCTYERLSGGAALPGGHAVASNKAPFLLSFTDPSKESTVDAFVLDPTSDPTTNEDATTYQHTLNGNADDNLLGFNKFIWDANSLIADYDHGLSVYAADDQLGWDVGGLGGEAPLVFSILDVRIDEMLRVLWATHDDLFRNVASGRPAFDMELAKSVFTSDNTRQYLSAFLHRCHHEIPVVHRPTFSVETASTALLLAMVMIGSMFCAPRDDTFSARRFISIAEEFIYNQELFTRHPRHFQTRAAEAHPEDIQTVQAALIIAILQSGMNDIQTRRRIRVQRHPQLVAVVRSLDLPSRRHRPSPSWHEFIADEIHIRLATYTFLFDAHLTLFLCHPPAMSLAEMTGALPSPSALFEASTPSDHARHSAAQLAAPPAPLSLSHWVSGLLSETPWPTCPSGPPSAPHLYLALQALQAVAHTARATGLGATSGAFAAVLRAADRWEQLWRRADVDADKNPADRSVRHAFLRHAAESCWLVRTVVRVAQAGGRAEGGGGAYMRCVGTDSYADVHGFIERYGRL